MYKWAGKVENSIISGHRSGVSTVLSKYTLISSKITLLLLGYCSTYRVITAKCKQNWFSLKIIIAYYNLFESYYNITQT